MLHLHLGGKGETCLCGLSSVIYQCVERSLVLAFAHKLFCQYLPAPVLNSGLCWIWPCVANMVKRWLKSCLLIFVHSAIKIISFKVWFASIYLGGKKWRVSNRMWILAVVWILSSWERVRGQHSLIVSNQIATVQFCRECVKLALLTGLAILADKSGPARLWRASYFFG